MTFLRTLPALALPLALGLAACADDTADTSSTSGDPGGTSSSSSGGGGTSTTSSTGSTGSTSSSSSGSGAGGGGGGEGGQAPMAAGAPGQSLVNAGTTMSSPGYKLVFTQGQSSPQQGQASSPSYQMKGGLTGATH